MQNSDVRRGRHCVFMMHVHLVFVTKYRRARFSADQLEFLKNIFESVCKDFNAELVEMNGERDHVHLLVNYPPNVSVSKLVKQPQGRVEPNASKAIAGRVRKMLWFLPVVAFVFRRQLRRSSAFDYQDIH